MQARAFGFDERKHMVIAAVHAMHESDGVAGSVRKAQSQDIRIETNRRADVSGEDQEVSQTPRLNDLDLASLRRSAVARRDRAAADRRLRCRRSLFGHAYFDKHAVGIAEPEAI